MLTRTTPSAVIALALFLGACSSPSSGPGHTGSERPEIPYGNTPEPTPPEITYPLECPALYRQDVFPTFELDIDPGNLATLREESAADLENWYPALFRHDGEEREVMVRNRGNLSPCGDKLQLAIGFNKIDPDGRYMGLRRINLDTGHCRVLDERLTLAFARDLGINAPCSNHARLVINGTFEGLFANLEAQNKDFLTRNFGPAGNDGDLWKEGYYLRTNEDDPEDRSTLDAFRHAEDIVTIEALTDLDQAVEEWAMEAVLPATDNFWVKGWNYYLYDHPERGMLFIPRDFDKALPWHEKYTDYDPLLPAVHHPIPIVLGDPIWMSKYEDALRRSLEKYDPDVFEARINTWWAQIVDAAAEDPSLGVDPGDLPPGRLMAYPTARIEWLRERLDAE